MRAVECQDSAPPRLAGVHHERRPLRWRSFEEPSGVRLRHARSFGDREGRQPQPRLKAGRVDPVGEPAVAVRELGIHVPVAGGALVAIVELDVAEKATVEVRGAEVDVGEHVGFRHLCAQLIPGAPTGGHGQRRHALSIHRR